ncbi:hypothetical protein, partial [Streptomyces sp. NPDC006510]|uniref:hypothetical protein n=1 Tax=Streptomyces sp. NPDC006510 TaxID=3155600 RepID=UPI0033B4719E
MTTTQEPADDAGDTLVVPSPDRYGRSLQDGSIRNQVWFVCLAYRFFGGLIGLRSDGGEAA